MGNKENSFKMLAGEELHKRSEGAIALGPLHTNRTTEIPKVSGRISKLNIFQSYLCSTHFKLAV